MSRVRACRPVGLNRSSLNYQSKRPADSAVRQRMRELAAQRRRFGYRRLGWLLVREGHVMNRKKLYRIYREEKLMVRRRGRRKRAIGTARTAGVTRCDHSALVPRLRIRCTRGWPPQLENPPPPAACGTWGSLDGARHISKGALRSGNLS